jgi:hypothetical protein
VLLLALLLAATDVGPDLGGVAPGTPIVAIRVVRYDVFDTEDPATASWPYRAANALHIVTRERYIRSLLLFREGDPLDPELLAESARLLRAGGFLSPVFIAARPVPGGAEVTVETHDQWTTELGLSIGLAGSQSKIYVRFDEDNFLGWGKQATVGWRSDPERESVILSYGDPLFLGTRWQLAAEYQDASDGSVEAFRLAYPFYALATPRTAGFDWRHQRRTEYLWSDGEKVVEGRGDRERLSLWGGIRLPSAPTVANRLTLGLFSERSEFADWQWRSDGSDYPDPEALDLSGVQVGFRQLADRWEVVTGFRAWLTQEDLPLGPNWGAELGFALPALGADRRALLFNGDLYLARLANRRYRWLAVGLSGRLEDGRGVVNSVSHLEVGACQLGDSALRGRLVLDLGHELDLDRQLTLGADVGLRGWEPNTFDGTSRAVLNLEWRRRLTGELLHIAVLGFEVFVDAGQTWDGRVGRTTDGVRVAAGIGLLAEQTRATLARLARLEVGFPDDGTGPLVILTGQILF